MPASKEETNLTSLPSLSRGLDRGCDGVLVGVAMVHCYINSNAFMFFYCQLLLIIHKFTGLSDTLFACHLILMN